TALGRPVQAVWANFARLGDDVALTAPELAHGAVLAIDGPLRGPLRGAGSPLELRVVGGPEAGRRIPLGRGTHVIGRGSDVPVRLDDPDLSRRHAVIDVGSGSITVADLGS